MSIKDTWSQEISTSNINDSFPEILHRVCSNLHYILLDNNDRDIENMNIKITYQIEKKKKTKRNKLRSLGNYQKIKENEEDKKCAICLQNFKKGTYKRKMPKCIHEFHKSCIDQWLYKDPNLSCPICRTKQIN